MINNIKTIIFTLIAIVIVPFITFAQDPYPGDFNSPEDYDPPAAPIDTHVMILLVFGLCYVFYKFRRTYKTIKN
jgi:hypothetical protein